MFIPRMCCLPPSPWKVCRFLIFKAIHCNSRSDSSLADSRCIGNGGFSEDGIGYCHTHSASLSHILFLIFFGGMTFTWNMQQPCLFIHDSNIVQIFCISSGVFLYRLSYCSFMTSWTLSLLLELLYLITSESDDTFCPTLGDGAIRNLWQRRYLPFEERKYRCVNKPVSQWSQSHICL